MPQEHGDPSATDRDERARESELYRLLAENVKDYAIFVIDLDRRVRTWTAGAERLLGYTEAEILGRSSDVFFTEEDRRKGTPEYEVAQATETGRGEDDRWHVRKDGSWFFSSGVMTPLWDEQGELRGCAKIMRDRTEWRQAEDARLASEMRRAAVLETALDAILSIDHQGRIVEWNPAAERLLGYRRDEILARDVIETLVPPEARDAYHHLLQRYLGRGDGPLLGRRLEVTAMRRDHSQFLAELTVTRVPLEGQSLFTAYVRDISESRRQEEQLREETRLAETLYRVGRSLSGELDLQRIVQMVTDETTSLTGAQFGAFFYNVIGEEDERYTLYSLSGVPREAFADFPMPRNTQIFELTFRGAGIVRLDDVTLDPRYGKNAPHYGMPKGHLPVRSYLAVPVISRSSEVLGGLFFGHAEPGRFVERHERLVAGIAGQAAVAIDNARLFEAARRERSRAETSERHYRTLAEVVPQLVWTTTPEGQLDWCNQRWHDATGMSLEETRGDGWIRCLHPDDVERSIHAWNRSVNTGMPYEIEYRFRTPTGTFRWYIARAAPVRDGEHQITGWFGTCTDIHDQKVSEESFRFLAEASASLASVVDYQSALQKVAWLAVPRFGDWCAVDMVDADGQLQRLAIAHKEAEKVELAYELERRYPRDPHARMGAAHVTRTGQAEVSGEIPDELLQEVAQDEDQLRILRTLGLRSYLCVPMKSRGQVIGVLTFVAAESGRRYGPADLALAQELASRAAVAVENARLYGELREADRRKDEFLAMLAHELRNPLAPIRSGLDVLRLINTDEELIEPMQQQVEHLVRLVDDLLDVSRIMRGRIELRMEPVELSTVIARAAESTRPAFAANEQTLSLDLLEEPVVLEADPVRLTQIIANLLHNAAKYTETGGQIWISSGRDEQEAWIEVRDTGIGMDADLLPKIFDLFTQADRTIDRSQGGLGIGLTVVRSLVEMHGGSITAHSEGTGKGSTFTVRMPIREGIEFHRPVLEPPASTPDYRILVVDDNVAAAMMLEVLLKKIGGHQVISAHDGPSALDAAARWRPHLILLDIGLPKMDGYEVARRIRRMGDQQCVLVALTGYGTEEDRRRSLEAGFDDHMVKPPSIGALRALLAHPRLSL